MQSLSTRLLVLTVGFIMLSEVLIYVPSISRFRVDWLEERINAAHLASLALIEAPQHMVSPSLTRMLLEGVGARAVVLKLPETRYLLLNEHMPATVDAVIDLRSTMMTSMVGDAFAALFRGDDRLLRVIGAAPRSPNATIEVVIDEAPLRAAMYVYSERILTLSIVISLVTATLVYASLQWLLVRPLRQLSESIIAFRRAPESEEATPLQNRRRDEVGLAQIELVEMQRELRAALRQKTRLAALGAAVSKVNHDLRNILATAQVVSDRLTESDDPDVRRITPRLIASIDRAINLCSRTLRFGQADEPPPDRQRFGLAGLVAEVGGMVGLPADGRVEWRNEVALDLEVYADREQLFRVFLNLGRNAVQAIAGPGRILVVAKSNSGAVEISISDTGGGLPDRVREHLFEPFAGAGRSGGTGLGLAIARDLMRAHGGDIRVSETGPDGTCFRLELPDARPKYRLSDALKQR
jgi:signal transduction histidine kinase